MRSASLPVIWICLQLSRSSGYVVELLWICGFKGSAVAALDLKLNPDTVSGKLSHKLSSPDCVEVEIRALRCRSSAKKQHTWLLHKD